MNIEEILAAQQAIVDAAEQENRSLSDEEVQNYENLEKELSAAQKTAEIRSRQAAYSAPNIITNGITTGAKGDEVLERAFENYLRTGVKNMDMVELRAQSEGTDTAGGFLAPDGFRQKIVEKMNTFGGIASVAEVINTSNGNPLPWVTTEPASADDAEITAENAKFSTGADLEFGTATLGAYKYTSVGDGGDPLRVSVELLQDSAFPITDFVSRKLGERIRRKQAEDYAVGDGTGEPLGLFHTTGDETGTLTYAKAVAMIHDIDPAYRDGASWVFNDAGSESLELMVDTSGRPLWNSSIDGLTGKVGGRFLGYPVVIDSSAPAVASGVAYAAFGDIREAYVIRNVRDITVVVDPYGRANYGQVQYVAWARSDGTIQNRDAYSTIKGS